MTSAPFKPASAPAWQLAWPLGLSLLGLALSQATPWPHYTVSLSTFVVTSFALLWQLRRHKGPALKTDLRTLGWLLVMVVPLAWMINLVLADTFFRYTNEAAVLGIRTPSLTRGRLSIRYLVPVEEYVFYLFGFLYMALLYLHARAVLPKQYPVGVAHLPWTHRPSANAFRFLVFVPAGTVLALFFYVQLRDWPSGFPAYLAYLLLVPFTCLLIVWNKVIAVVHQGALRYALFVMVFVSVIWEGLLAVPNRWWGYNQRLMIGIFLSPGLPLEAVAVWFLGPLTTIVALVSIESVFQGQSLLDQ